MEILNIHANHILAGMNNFLRDHFRSLKDQRDKGLAILIDPDKVSERRAHQLADLANECKVNCLLIGGSLVQDQSIHELIPLLKSFTNIPIVLFPGSLQQISPDADALLFLSLISGRNPDLLIGKHVEAAPLLKDSQLDIIPTGYMLIESGNFTTAHYISNTLPIPRHKADIAVCTALAGQMLGLQLIYMDGGSGAQKAIPASMIQAVSQSINIPLVIGGGIRRPAEAMEAWLAGADMIVVGSAIEEDEEGKLLREFSQARDEVCTSLNFG